MWLCPGSALFVVVVVVVVVVGVLLLLLLMLMLLLLLWCAEGAAVELVEVCAELVEVVFAFVLVREFTPLTLPPPLAPSTELTLAGKGAAPPPTPTAEEEAYVCEVE